MMYYYNDIYPSHMFGFGPLVSVLFWIVLVYVLVSIFRQSHHHSHREKPIDILKERYAKGEINKEQFESMKKDLNY